MEFKELLVPWNYNLSHCLQMKTEILDQFQGRYNVRHITSDNGAESFLTQEVSFADETTAKGACKLNTIESETKHILFLFNSNDEEVGRYYLGKKLQGKTPEKIVDLNDNLVFFESWNIEIKTWVPCVGINKTQQYAQPLITDTHNQAVPFPPDQEEGPQDASFEKRPKFEYTEEMFKQEIADQEERDLLEYGTSDKNKIAQIKKDKKDNRNFWIFIIIVGIIMYMFMGLIAKCTESKFDPFEDNKPWEPRHTQIYRQMPTPLCHIS